VVSNLEAERGTRCGTVPHSRGTEMSVNKSSGGVFSEELRTIERQGADRSLRPRLGSHWPQKRARVRLTFSYGPGWVKTADSPPPTSWTPTSTPLGTHHSESRGRRTGCRDRARSGTPRARPARPRTTHRPG